VATLQYCKIPKHFLISSQLATNIVQANSTITKHNSVGSQSNAVQKMHLIIYYATKFYDQFLTFP